MDEDGPDYRQQEEAEQEQWEKNMTTNAFAALAAIDVSKHIEKKQNLSYLSWAWAVDQLMRADPAANWEFHEPKMFGETMMVSCTVTAFGKPVTMHLPVMDHRNQAVKNPDAFVVNKNMMRCLVKAIACHGLGLYIYAGEDLPMDEEGNTMKPQQQRPAQAAPAQEEHPFDLSKAIGWIDKGKTLAEKEARARTMYGKAASAADKAAIKAHIESIQQAEMAAA